MDQRAARTQVLAAQAGVDQLIRSEKKQEREKREEKAAKKEENRLKGVQYQVVRSLTASPSPAWSPQPHIVAAGAVGMEAYGWGDSRRLAATEWSCVGGRSGGRVGGWVGG